MMDPAQLAALASVHRRGSFELAAAELSVTPSAISQRIKAFEEGLGTLLVRRGQPCVATEVGLRLIRHFEAIQVLEQAALAALPGPRRGGGAVPLRIAVNADSLATWVIPALAAVEGFLFDLVIDDQQVSDDWLRRGEVAGAITGTDQPLPGCDCLPLGRLRYRATASGPFLARWMPDGPTADALGRAPALVFSDKDRLQSEWVARLGLGTRIAMPSHRIGSSQGFVDACLAGLGWGMNPEPLVAHHLALGTLVEVAPQPLDVPLYWQFARLTGQALAPLTGALRKAAGSCLLPI